MALKIKWTRNALEHLVDILHYWEVKNGTNSYSIKLYKLFQDSLNLLSRYPTSGTITSNHLIRKKTVRDYFLYYSFDESNVIVLGIVDMRRNPKFIKTFEK